MKAAKVERITSIDKRNDGKIYEKKLVMSLLY